MHIAYAFIQYQVFVVLPCSFIKDALKLIKHLSKNKIN